MKRALVTGVSSGIGAAVASALLDDGWAVVGVSRRKPDILWRDGFTWIHAELRTAWQLVASSHRFDDGLDALIHCAAEQGPVGLLLGTDPLGWEQCVKVNLFGTLHVLQAALPYLLKRDDARVLLFSGGGAFGPRPNYSAYAASKAGVVALMETLADELTGRATVNCVAPGFVPTPIHRATLEAGPERAGWDAWQRAFGAEGERERDRLPDVVACVRHLLAPDTRGLTGKTISVEHDGWRSVTADRVSALNASDVWTRTRVSAEPDDPWVWTGHAPAFRFRPDLALAPAEIGAD